jgi:putative Mn2+ efflux pump MntP
MVISTSLTAFLIALSCNLDNVGVGISYGTRRIRLPLATNLYIALLTAAGTYLAMVLGQQVFRFFSPSCGAVLGGGILVAMGVWVLLQEMVRWRQPPAGLALMLNNLPNGVAAAMIKLPALLTTLAVGILSLLTFWLGISIGRYLGDRSEGAWTWVVSATILIGIGLAEIVLALPWKS